ncbi:MAG TPA: hypothetical protein VLM89_09010 [Phycisphaerae bacterium]|nr:hypothetical protein [Phycisphaerae bacterium]
MSRRTTPKPTAMTGAGRRQEIVSLLAAALARLPQPAAAKEPDMPCFGPASAAQCDRPAGKPANGGQAA